MGNIYNGNNGNNRYTGYIEGIYGSFIYKIKQTVYKWWCVVYKPVYKLTHDGYFPPEKEPDNKYPETPAEASNSNNSESNEKQLAAQMAKEMADKIMNEHNDVSEFITDIDTADTNDSDTPTNSSESASNDSTDSVNSTSNNDNLMDTLSSIMNANKVDISPFIEEGKANFMELKEQQEKEANEEALLKAQEIMDRLNREAAEDEAKKQAEIDEAKRQAGVL